MNLNNGKINNRRFTAGFVLRTVALTAILLSPLAGGAVPSASASQCQFTMGFAILRDMINQAEGTDTVGSCLEDIHYDANGNGLQHTSGGLLAWAQETNWTGFTDGTSTWVNGPNGLEKRLNSEQLPWEEEAGGPDGPEFSLFRPKTAGSFVTIENLGNNTYHYVVNGTDQVFIGMGYNPIYRNLSDEDRAANYDRDFRILCQAGVNQITGWDADKGYEQDKFDEVTLNELQKFGLGVIMPFYLPPDGNYQDPAFQQSLMDQATIKIKRFKDYPAIRMWGVGNEVLSVMQTPDQRVAFLQFYIQLIDLFHDQDPDHPVVYREAEDTFVPLIKSFLDNSPKPRPWFILGMNVYTNRLDRILDDWPSYGIDSPIIVSEFGAEPTWPGGRAIGYLSMWHTIRSYPNYVLGGAPYVWTTQGPEPVDAKWGLMDGQSRPVDNTFDLLKSAWLQEGSRSCP